MNLPFTILGSTGFIGSSFAAHLKNAGIPFHAPDRNSWSPPAEGWGHVLYAIGLTSDFRQKPMETVEAHVCILKQILQRGGFASLTYLSSTRVYQNSPATDENAPLSVDVHQPGDLYNLSKLMGESLCLHAGIPRVRVIRLSNVVGMRKDHDLFIGQLLHEALSTGKLVLHSSLSSSKDYLHLPDAMDMILKIATTGRESLYNVASGENVSNARICRLLENKFGTSIEVAPDAREWSFETINISRIRKEFGFDPESFDCYFETYADTYQHQLK